MELEIFISFAKPLQTNSAVLQAGLSILAWLSNSFSVKVKLGDVIG